MIEPLNLEHLMGRPLSPADRGSITNLNDVPEALVEEARKLGTPILARTLLAHYTTSNCRSYLKNFVDDVVFGDVSPKLWRRGGALVPALSISGQLCQPRENLLAPIGGYSGLRTMPRIDSWRAGASWIGAPAQPRPDAYYRTVTPVGAALLSRPLLENAPNVTLTVRRWIASRLARVLAAGTPTSIDAIFALAPSLPPLDRWSPDARAAAAALMREYQTMGAPMDAIPGFRAPDGWLSGS
jgi:hypothetical protein